MKSYAYVPAEQDTMREARCPYCSVMNFVAGVMVKGWLRQEQVGELASSVCPHYAGTEHTPQGRIKSIVFDSEVAS